MSIIFSLPQKKFTGRCEYYATDGFMLGLKNCYLVGLGLKNTKNEVPSYNWWLEFKKKLDKELSGCDDELTLDHDFSELSELRALRAHYLPRGSVQFIKGLPALVLNSESTNGDSFFISCVNETTQQAGQPDGGEQRCANRG